MAGATVAINDAAAEDTILSVKERVFAANRTLFVHRQRLVYTAGPSGMDVLADYETLRDVGVAQDGSAELDVLLADLTEEDLHELGANVWSPLNDVSYVTYCYDMNRFSDNLCFSLVLSVSILFVAIEYSLLQPISVPDGR
jgi:hypothetical protein